jgi:hypothetical protein
VHHGRGHGGAGDCERGPFGRQSASDYPDRERHEVAAAKSLVPVAWENILDVWYNYVKGHNPKDYFGIYDVVRFDTFWLDKA